MLATKANALCKACAGFDVETFAQLFKSSNNSTDLLRATMTKTDSAIYLAVINNRSTVCELLVQRCQVSKEEAEIVRQGLHTPNPFALKSPIQTCFERGFLDVARVLLNRGIVLEIDAEEETNIIIIPLHLR